MRNPASPREVVGWVAHASAAQVEEAIAAAADAAANWGQAPLSQRREALLTAATRLRAVEPELVRLYVRENGKVWQEAARDVSRSIEVLTVVAEEAETWLRPHGFGPRGTVRVYPRPRGVTAVISPWNSPLLLTMKRLAPALVAGNPVVVKPASSCPLTVMAALEVMRPVFPPGVLGLVSGAGETVGMALVQDPRVRTVAFTGSTETGRRIANASPNGIKRFLLELGGNDPALVLADADLSAESVEALRLGVLRATGQVCTAIKRIYVHRSRYSELVDKLSASFSQVVVGSGLDPRARMGPLQNPNQWQQVRALLDRAQAAGAQVVTVGSMLEGADPEGYWQLPSLVLGAGPEDEVVQVEQFGPLVPILPFDSLEEAIAQANQTHYGLRASVWTSSPQTAQAVAQRLEAGAVFVNHHTYFQDLRLDFSGVKESGLSVSTEHAALEGYVDWMGVGLPGD